MIEEEKDGVTITQEKTNVCNSPYSRTRQPAGSQHKAAPESPHYWLGFLNTAAIQKKQKHYHLN